MPRKPEQGVRELRCVGELRGVSEEGREFVLEALAHRTGVRTEIFDFTEEISPGAFKAAIPKSDIVLNVNHGRSSGVLARTSSGTMRVYENDDGLMLRARLGMDDPEAQSLVSKINRGDLAALSFAMTVNREGQAWSAGKKMPHRQITKVAELFDVSIVERPAFPETEIISARDQSAAAHRSEAYAQAHDDVRRTALAEVALRGHRSR